MAVINSIYNNPLAGGAYSNTPVRIGTWIDGTPIWRYAWSIEFPSSYDKSVVDCTLPVSSISNISMVVNLKAYGAQKDGDTLKFIADDTGDYYIDNNSFKFAGPTYFTMKPSNDLYSHPYFEGWMGYIDFVTAESNIKVS